MVGREYLFGCFETETPQPQFTKAAQVHRGRGCQDTYPWVSTKADCTAAQPTDSFSGLPEDPSPCGLRKPPGSWSAPPSPLTPALKVWGSWAARLGGGRARETQALPSAAKQDAHFQSFPRGPGEFCLEPFRGPWGFLICFQSVNICN